MKNKSRRIRKKLPLFTIRQRRSGIILITVIWILAILSVMAIGLSRKLSIDLTLVKHEIGVLQAELAAKAGVAFMQHQVKLTQEDQEDQEDTVMDFTAPCGHRLSVDGQDQVVKHVPVTEGVHFSFLDQGNDSRFGWQDEAARLNINHLDNRNYTIFAYLLQSVAGVDEKDSYSLALAAVDWKDEDGAPSNTLLGEGAEQPVYNEERHPLNVKNSFFSSVAELSLVKGFTPDIVDAIEDYVTVFPLEQQRWLMINLNMATEPLIRAIALSFPNSDALIIDRVMEVLMKYRRGVDDQLCTADDGTLFLGEESVVVNNDVIEQLSASEQAVYRNLVTVHASRSAEYIRLYVLGEDEHFHVRQRLETVIRLTDQHIMAWELL